MVDTGIQLYPFITFWAKFKRRNLSNYSKLAVSGEKQVKMCTLLVEIFCRLYFFFLQIFDLELRMKRTVQATKLICVIIPSVLSHFFAYSPRFSLHEIGQEVGSLNSRFGKVSHLFSRLTPPSFRDIS